MRVRKTLGDTDERVVAASLLARCGFLGTAPALRSGFWREPSCSLACKLHIQGHLDYESFKVSERVLLYTLVFGGEPLALTVSPWGYAAFRSRYGIARQSISLEQIAADVGEPLPQVDLATTTMLLVLLNYHGLKYYTGLGITALAAYKNMHETAARLEYEYLLARRLGEKVPEDYEVLALRRDSWRRVTRLR